MRRRGNVTLLVAAFLISIYLLFFVWSLRVRSPREDLVQSMGDDGEEPLRIRRIKQSDQEEPPRDPRLLALNFSDEQLQIRFIRLPKQMAEICSGISTAESEEGAEGGNASAVAGPLSARLLIAVLSSPGKGKIRDAIRRTWGSAEHSDAIRNHGARLFFLIGNGEHEITAVKEEAERHDDIITVDVNDTYLNLVYKVFAIMHLGTAICPSQFVLKVDEDVVFHVDRFFSLLGNVFNPAHTAIYCTVWRRTRPYRNPQHQWYISYSQYNGSLYPPFCSGSSYIMTSHAARRLLHSTANVSAIHVEDVLITGIISQAAGVRRVSLPSMFHSTNRFYKTCPRGPTGARALMSKHGFKNPKAIETAWTRMFQECPRPPTVIPTAAPSNLHGSQHEKGGIKTTVLKAVVVQPESLKTSSTPSK